tara:strand:+ start:2052 stop:2339 length:288 start_codon:yes stop_codon:yes gene_type:complete
MKKITLFEDILIIDWQDGQETIISYVKLREGCPCAMCGGESDVMGNIYGGEKIVANKNIKILKYNNIGHYGLQFYFSDGHKDGIYTFDFLKKLQK